MTGSLRCSLLAAALVLSIAAPEMEAQRRRVVVRRGGVARTTVVVRPGHPIRRSVARTVIVRPMRTRVVVGAPLLFLPAVMWGAAVVSLPARDRLVWQDSERIEREEDWVDCNFGVDQRGDALYLEVAGRAQLDFAEVTFENGNVQVVDFEDKTHGTGIFRLLDFKDGRQVKTVRLLAKSKSDETKLSVFLQK